MKILKLFFLSIIILLIGQSGVSRAAEPIVIKVSPLIIPLELTPDKESEAIIIVTNPNSYQIKLFPRWKIFW